MTGSATLDAAIEAHRLTAEIVADIAWRYAERSKASAAYWVGGADNGCEYCEDCIDAAVDAAKAAAEPSAEEDGDAIFCDGGWDDRRTSDGPCFCETCDRILGYALTSEGLAEEVTALADRAEPILPAKPAEAYAAFAIIDAAVDELTYRAKPSQVTTAIKAIDIACREIGITREMARQLAR